MLEEIAERARRQQLFGSQTPGGVQKIVADQAATEIDKLYQAKIEKLENPLKEVYERFKGWGGIVEDFAHIHQKDGRPASENLSDIQGHFLVELWKAIKQALGET